MIKKFFVAMGIVFMALIGGCVVMLGGVSLNAAEEAPQNKAVAAAAAQDLARAWDVNDLRPHFASVAISQINFGAAQQSINSLKALGALRKIEDAQQTAFHYNKSFGGETTKTATIEMVGEFENGRATVTVQLANEGKTMKLMHVHVVPIGDIRTKRQQA